MEEDIQNYSPTVMFRGTSCFFFQLLLLLLSIIPCTNFLLSPDQPSENAGRSQGKGNSQGW